MLKSYKDIFNRRGFYYHQAMIEYPLARKEEFWQIIQLAELQNNHVIGDIPSGGSYLNYFLCNFLSLKCKIISIETAAEFIRYSFPQENNFTLITQKLSNLSLTDESMDRVISLAGLHHVDNKLPIYREIYRLLKSNGIFCLADVLENSKVANFLNIFVDRYNSLGHQGLFLNKQTKNELEAVGFKVIFKLPISYYWQFDSQKSMINYCQLLFGLDLADDKKILKGIEENLGYQVIENKYFLNWQLYFLKCIKDSHATS